MRKMLMGLLAAAFVVMSAAPVLAQTPQHLQQFGQWSTQMQGVQISIINVLQQSPPFPQSGGRDTERAWAASGRAWLVNFERAVAEGRRVVAQMAPTDALGDFRADAQSIYDTYPTMLQSFETLIQSYRELYDAVERNDPSVRRRATIGNFDTSILMLRQFRDINTAQAATVPGDHPQRYLLYSYATSYDGLIASLELQRASIDGEPNNRAATAATLETAVTAMRTHISAGRAAARTTRAQLQTLQGANAEEQRMLGNVLRMMDSYGHSFDQEDLFANHLSSAVALLRRQGAYTDLEREFGTHMDAIGLLDTQRASDGQARTALMQ